MTAAWLLAFLINPGAAPLVLPSEYPTRAACEASGLDKERMLLGIPVIAARPRRWRFYCVEK